ncbi:response regulator [Hasllibacter sp. MH4015]|uniref:response regulator n=1 Tax=Hasllibacter sp. MH4015 TaxID=2854029 RepID=UPI001CD4C36F|nr:response regulator [Hasllibacter sp. MH4015]
MTEKETGTDLGAALASELPFLRRYARALTGAQDSGDRYAIATLEAIVADPTLVSEGSDIKLSLFRTFHGIWSTSGASVDDGGEISDLLEARAQWRLSHLAPNTREALLLRSIEGFGFDAIAKIMDLSSDEAEDLYNRAMADMGDSVRGDILIIEDEGIIAMDLNSIVSDMGHTVTDIARTRDDAIAKGKAKVPDLILADIQLADKSSGIDAVNALLSELGDRPVIFITAFPERLLTGDKPEPAFLITKPYSEDQVRTAVSQAMFFATTERMGVAV